MQKIVLIMASVSGALAVGIGAFGAHGLSRLLEQNQRMGTFETAVQYHFYHTFALLAIGLLMDKFPGGHLTWAAYAMAAGILVFSGSLYALSLSNVTKWGMITPIGGLLFIVGWLLIGVALLKSGS